MLKLVQTDWGQFDLAFDDPADADTDAAIATLILGVIFTDAEGPSERVGEAWNRRGWWADSTAGTGIWHVRWQALTDSARREAAAELQQAIASRSEAFDQVEVSIESAAGNVSCLILVVSGYHNGREFAFKAEL